MSIIKCIFVKYKFKIFLFSFDIHDRDLIFPSSITHIEVIHSIPRFEKWPFNLLSCLIALNNCCLNLRWVLALFYLRAFIIWNILVHRANAEFSFFFDILAIIMPQKEVDFIFLDVFQRALQLTRGNIRVKNWLILFIFRRKLFQYERFSKFLFFVNCKF